MGPWNPVNSPVEGQVVYPIIYKVLAPSQVVQEFFHQQYQTEIMLQEVLRFFLICLAHGL